MALSVSTWYFLVISTILALFAFAYGLLMAQTFLKKRTLGTAFLMFAFVLLGIGEIINTVAFWLSAYGVTSSNIVGILQFIFVNLYSLSLLFFYYFSTRHILRDNDFVKSITGVFFGELIAAMTALMLGELLFGLDIGFNTISNFLIQDTTIEVYSPSAFLALLLYVPLLFIILVRVIWNIVSIRRKISEPVAKIGITYISLSVISMIGSTLVLIIMHIPGIYAVSGLVLFFQTLRAISTIARLIFGYLGWILPDWLKRRVRGKTWIAKELKTRVSEKISYSYSSSKDIDAQTIPIKEVSER